jgi:hypothetical protein
MVTTNTRGTELLNSEKFMSILQLCFISQFLRIKIVLV